MGIIKLFFLGLIFSNVLHILNVLIIKNYYGEIMLNIVFLLISYFLNLKKNNRIINNFNILFICIIYFILWKIFWSFIYIYGYLAIKDDTHIFNEFNKENNEEMKKIMEKIEPKDFSIYLTSLNFNDVLEWITLYYIILYLVKNKYNGLMNKKVKNNLFE